MMDLLRGWIISICSIVILISAIELIIPNNSFKKYAKFVYGLVLMVVIAEPILLLVGGINDNSISGYIDRAEQEFRAIVEDNAQEVYQNNYLDTTSKLFKENLERECEVMLERSTYGKKFKVDMDVVVDLANNNASIEKVDVGVYDSGIKPIDQVVIGEPTSQNQPIPEEDEIKEILSNELQIPKEMINVYSL